MKSRNFVWCFAVAVIIGFLVWFFLRPKAPVPGHAAGAPVSARADVPKVIASTAQVELPAAPAVQPKMMVGEHPADAAAAPDVDPRANLNTAIAEIIRLYEVNDDLTRVKEFFTPEDLDRVKSTMNMSIEAWVQLGEQYPEAAHDRENMLSIWRSMQGETPILSNDGNLATYDTVTLDGSHKKAALKKHDGLWYIGNVEP